MEKANTAAAVRLHASNDLLDMFHKFGITLPSGSKYYFLDQLGKFNMDGVIEGIRHATKPGKVTIDNIGGLIRVKAVRRARGNKHYHYTASTYYVDPVDAAHLSMAQPRVPYFIDPSVLFF